MRKLFVMAILVLSIFACYSVGTQFQTNSGSKPVEIVPVDPSVTIGKLDNGLVYYIKQNKKPENRVELLLAVNIGSVLETDDQQGLAHFVEHMAFNGTKNFPKQDLVNYLESIGMEFGPDLNAYTSFDETVYMLTVPTDDAEKLEKAFQILEDWAHNLSFEDEEIDKERGVVIEEWRLGQGANMRMIDKQLPIILQGSKYAQRLPIGKKAVLDTFQYQTPKEFYSKWYKPDLMAVIAVGDFEKPAIEGLIQQYFSNIPSLPNPTQRPEIPVPDHDETLFAIASDPEASYSNVSLIYKFDIDEDKVSILAFRSSIVFKLYNGMLNNRLNELTKTADPPFLYVMSRKGSWVQSKEMYTLTGYVKTNGIPRGLEALLTEATRVQKFGFTQTELDRQKTKYLRGVEKQFNERDKTESGNLKWKFKNNFLKGESIPSIEFVYETVQELLPGITLEEVNHVSMELIKDKNRVVTASSPENEDVIIPTEMDLRNIFNTVSSMDLEPYVDAVLDKPLVESLRPPGKVISEKVMEEIGVTEWTLENGVKVVLKPTDFKNDEILLSAHSPGGHSLVVDSEYMAASTATSIISESGVGSFTKIELDKLLSDKIVRVTPWLSSLQEGLKSNVSPQDQETMFQLIYQYFNAPRYDSTAFLAYKSRMQGWIENRDARPENTFRDTIQVTQSQHHFRARPWTMEILEEMNLESSFKIYKDRFADAGDFIFYLVGNFELDGIKPLVETYLGSLPTAGRVETWKDIGMNPPVGIVENSVHKGMEPKSMVHITFTGSFEWNPENRHILESLKNVMEIKLREVMREDMGGTYGVWMWTSPSHYPKERYEFNIRFGCSPENVDTLTQAVFTQIDSVQSYGIDTEYISKVQEIQRRERETKLKENQFWLGTLESNYFHGEDPLQILKYDQLVDSINPDVIQTAAAKYLNQENYMKVILYPEVVE